MPENLYPKLPTAPSTSQESFNIEMVRKTIKTFLILKQKYTGTYTYVPQKSMLPQNIHRC